MAGLMQRRGKGDLPELKGSCPKIEQKRDMTWCNRIINKLLL